MKKNICYSLWGSNSTYTHGVEENFNLIKKFYPDWQMVVYYDNTVPTEYLQNKEITFIEFDSKYNGGLARYLGLFNSDLYLSRDLDSRITEREVQCVNRWLNSPQKILSLKDHKNHMSRPLLEGMFGVKNGFDQDDYDALKRYIYNKKWATDSVYLREHVAEKYKNDILEYTCFDDEYLKTTRTKDFMGQGYYADGRPRYHWQTGVPL